MGVGIELDTENSIRKYQICKPVAPQQNLNRNVSIEAFSLYVARLFAGLSEQFLYAAKGAED